METRKPGQQTQTQSASQAQSGYKKPSQSVPGAGGPSSSRREPSQPGSRSSVSSALPMDKLKKMIGVAAVVLGVAVGAYWMASPSDPEPTQAQIEERAQQYEQLLAQAGGVIGLQSVKDSERQDALATILSAQERQQLEQKKVPLVWITLWDTAAEDGDVVHVISDGFSQEVPILHAPTRVAVPLPSSGTVAVTGSHDGGGGITIGILTGSQRIPIPYLRVGQTINVPVSGTP